MIECIFNLHGTSGLQPITKVQIINISHANLISGTCKYQVIVCDGTDRSAIFLHKRTDDLFVLIQKAMKALLKSGIDSKKRIPPSEYVLTNGEPRVTLELVKKYHTPEEVGRFCKFMIGQTRDSGGIFPWDYERWINQGMRDCQLADFD